MRRVFISYRRSDAEDVTGRIHEHLVKRYGVENIFKDVDSIDAGADFRHAISTAIDACDILLVVIGKQWVTSLDEDGNRRLEDPRDFVRWEIECALKRGRPLIPLLVQNAKMPELDELPEGIQDLAHRNAIPIRPDPDFAIDVHRLHQAIGRITGRDEAKFGGMLLPWMSIAALFVSTLLVSWFLVYGRTSSQSGNDVPASIPAGAEMASRQSPGPEEATEATSKGIPGESKGPGELPQQDAVGTHSAPAPNPTPKAQEAHEPANNPRHRVELVRLVCHATNDLDGKDQVVLKLKIDGAEFEHDGVKYSELFRGQPCVSLEKGDAWPLGITLSFEREAVVVFRDLDKLTSVLGELHLTAKNLTTTLQPANFIGGGNQNNRYTLEWRVVE